MKELDLLVLRQRLGDISKQEAAQAQDVVSKWYRLSKGRKEPAEIRASRIPYFLFAAASVSIIGYAIFVKKYAYTWALSGFAPVLFWRFYDSKRQPLQDLENAYNYIIARRQATLTYDAHKDEVVAALGPEAGQLRTYLTDRNQTLYHLEAELVDKMVKNEL